MHIFRGVVTKGSVRLEDGKETGKKMAGNRTKMGEELVLELVYRLSRLPVCVYTESWEPLGVYGTDGKREETYDRRIFQQIQKCLGEKRMDQVFIPYDQQVPIGLYGGRAGGRIYILGPFCYGPLHTMEAGRFLRKNRLGDYPECRMEDARNVIWFLRHSGDTAVQQESAQVDEQFWSYGVTDQESVTEEVWQMEAFQRNHTYREEEKLYRCIREGNVAYLEQHMEDIELPHPILLEDVKKNEEYMAVTGISLAARAAVEGGISSKEAFLYNDLYLKKIAACRDIQAIHKVHGECYLQFARIVRDRKKKETALNRHVEECKRAIVARRFERIMIDELAKDVGISKEYLQKLFRQHEGIPITEYIADKKLEAACNMLVFSDRKISDIADQLHFGSVSHFSLVFKRKKGQSPREYRCAHQRTVY